MKKILCTILVTAMLFVASCSSQPSTPQEQLTAISTMLAKGYEMNDDQRQEIDEKVKTAKSLLESGKTEDAAALLTKVLKKLDFIAEADAFNKSE